MAKQTDPPLEFGTFEVVGDYYESAWGPSILLILRSKNSATWIRRHILEQIEVVGPRELLGEKVGVNNVSSLLLVTRPEGRDFDLKLSSDEIPASFILACTERGWLDMALHLEPFCEGLPGHQYFGWDGIDDAYIEISLGEGMVLSS